MIYPESKFKAFWDLFITFVLLFTSFKTPYDIAFTGIDTSLADRLPDYLVDAFFLLDVIVIMNSAFYNDEVYLIDDRKIIIIEYYYYINSNINMSIILQFTIHWPSARAL